MFLTVCGNEGIEQEGQPVLSKVFQHLSVSARSRNKFVRHRICAKGFRSLVSLPGANTQGMQAKEKRVQG